MVKQDMIDNYDNYSRTLQQYEEPNGEAVFLTPEEALYHQNNGNVILKTNTNANNDYHVGASVLHQERKNIEAEGVRKANEILHMEDVWDHKSPAMKNWLQGRDKFLGDVSKTMHFIQEMNQKVNYHSLPRYLMRGPERIVGAAIHGLLGFGSGAFAGADNWLVRKVMGDKAQEAYRSAKGIDNSYYALGELGGSIWGIGKFAKKIEGIKGVSNLKNRFPGMWKWIQPSYAVGITSYGVARDTLAGVYEGDVDWGEAGTDVAKNLALEGVLSAGLGGVGKLLRYSYTDELFKKHAKTNWSNLDVYGRGAARATIGAGAGALTAGEGNRAEGALLGATATTAVGPWALRSSATGLRYLPQAFRNRTHSTRAGRMADAMAKAEWVGLDNSSIEKLATLVDPKGKDIEGTTRWLYKHVGEVFDEAVDGINTIRKSKGQGILTWDKINRGQVHQYVKNNFVALAKSAQKNRDTLNSSYKVNHHGYPRITWGHFKTKTTERFRTKVEGASTNLSNKVQNEFNSIVNSIQNANPHQYSMIFNKNNIDDISADLAHKFQTRIDDITERMKKGDLTQDGYNILIELQKSKKSISGLMSSIGKQAEKRAFQNFEELKTFVMTGVSAIKKKHPELEQFSDDIGIHVLKFIQKDAKTRAATIKEGYKVKDIEGMNLHQIDGVLASLADKIGGLQKITSKGVQQDNNLVSAWKFMYGQTMAMKNYMIYHGTDESSRHLYKLIQQQNTDLKKQAVWLGALEARGMSMGKDAANLMNNNFVRNRVGDAFLGKSGSLVASLMSLSGKAPLNLSNDEFFKMSFSNKLYRFTKEINPKIGFDLDKKQAPNNYYDKPMSMMELMSENINQAKTTMQTIRDGFRKRVPSMDMPKRVIPQTYLMYIDDDSMDAAERKRQYKARAYEEFGL